MRSRNNQQHSGVSPLLAFAFGIGIATATSNVIDVLNTTPRYSQKTIPSFTIDDATVHGTAQLDASGNIQDYNLVGTLADNHVVWFTVDTRSKKISASGQLQPSYAMVECTDGSYIKGFAEPTPDNILKHTLIRAPGSCDNVRDPLTTAQKLVKPLYEHMNRK